MTLLIDPPNSPGHGRLWSHLASDASYDELHRFAAGLGIPPRGFDRDHYDVPEERYAALVTAGAQPVSGREIVRLLHASGLRIPKRRHERVLLSHPAPSWLPPGSRADVIASRQDSPPANTVVVRLLAHAAGSVLVVPRGDGGVDLPSRALGAETGHRAVEEALHEVQSASLGRPATADLVGYVRNTVPDPGPDYPWPAPRACFAVFARAVEPGARHGSGQWLSLDEAAGHLGERHWWPLVPEFFNHPGRHRATP